MPFAGEAFEEFVAGYLRHMPEYKGYIVNVHVDYKRTKELQKEVKREKTRQAYWSDIDVLAIKGNEAIIVSCDENCQKKVKRVLQEFEFAERHVKQEYPFITEIKKFYAFSMAGQRAMEKLNILERQHNIRILAFADMVRNFIGMLREQANYPIICGKFTDPIMWVLREMDEIWVLTGSPVFPPINTSSKRRNWIVHWPLQER